MLAASSAAQKTGPASTVGPTGCSANRKEVTTPKLPPPPRSAQNRPGCSSAAARGQAVGLRFVVDVAPQSTALHPGRATGGVDPHGPHRREVDDDPVVAHGGAGHAVAAAPDGDLQVVVACEAHRCDHI